MRTPMHHRDLQKHHYKMGYYLQVFLDNAHHRLVALLYHDHLAVPHCRIQIPMDLHPSLTRRRNPSSRDEHPHDAVYNNFCVTS
jgi:hypothetical protein